MVRKYLSDSSKKVALLSRLLAKAVDFFIALILLWSFYPIGVLLATAYICVGDFMQDGQSIGKRLMGFYVISLVDGSPCSLKQSIVRNLPFIIPLLIAIIPFWGWVITFGLGTALVALELYLLTRLDSGHRLGDVMADTTVIANDPYRQDFKDKKQGWFESESTSSISRSNISD